MIRPTWDEVFIDVAWNMAARSTCNKLKVGCVLVDERHRVVSTGFNGAPSGWEHCTDVGCLRVDGHCVRSNHAEVNALLNSGSRLSDVRGGVAYVTSFPCKNCLRQLCSVGIARIHYARDYGKYAMPEMMELARKQGVEFTRDGQLEPVEVVEDAE